MSFPNYREMTLIINSINFYLLPLFTNKAKYSSQTQWLIGSHQQSKGKGCYLFLAVFQLGRYSSRSPVIQLGLKPSLVNSPHVADTINQIQSQLIFLFF